MCIVFYEVGLIAEVILLGKNMSDIYGQKFKITRAYLLFVLVDFLVMNGADAHLLSKGWAALVYMVMLLYCILSFHPTVKELMINMILAFTMVACLQLICGFLIYRVSPADWLEVKKICLIHILTLGLYLLLSGLFNIRTVSLFFCKGYRMVSSLLAIGFTIVFVRGIKYKINTNGDHTWDVVMAVVIIVILIVTFKYMRMKEKSIENEEKLNAYRIYAASYENLVEEIRARQHEFDNHIMAILNQHILYKDYEELVSHQRAYCEEMALDNRYARLLKLGKSAFTGFLYGKLLEAEKNQIRVEYSIGVSEEVFGIPDYRLIEIVGNFLNNAMEAIMSERKKESNDSEASIGLRIEEEGGYAMITVENTGEFLDDTVMSNFFMKGYSKKGERRGLGLYRVKRLSEEYHFDLLYGNVEKEGEHRVYFQIRKKIN